MNLEDNTALNILKPAGLENSHWGKILIDAYEEGRTEEHHVHEAGNWTTCACGKQDPRIPRITGPDAYSYNRDEPLDHALKNLGMTFYDLIGDANTSRLDFGRVSIVTAAQILVKIEERAAVVLFETLAQHQGLPNV